jgi:5-methylcytosine-specific restriction protein A
LTAGPGAVQACTAKVQSGAGHIGRPRALAIPHYDTGRTIDLDRWHDTSRRGEPLWRSWCKSPTWKSIRRHRLAEEPRCRQCAIEGRTVAASQVDHIEPHLGQWLLFFKYENTQSLCTHHHNMHKQQEKRGNCTQSRPDHQHPINYRERTQNTS